MSNAYGIDYDKPGFCALCHCELAKFNGSRPDGTMVIVELLPIFCTVPVTLDDGSTMLVSMCTTCRSTFTPDKAGQVMESVINGWVWETDHLLNWTPDKKAQHVKEYSQRFITKRLDAPWADDVVLPLPSAKKLHKLSAKSGV